MQRDFGGFDPAFVGVTLRFESERAWKRFQEIAESSTPTLVSEMDDDTRFETLSLATVISHEVRHFHDFLLSPYSARVFSLRLKALVNELGTLNRFVDPTVNVVPVPVPSWCRLSTVERAERISELGFAGNGAGWRAPEVPEKMVIDASVAPVPLADGADAASAFAGLVQAGAHARGQIHALTYNPTYVARERSFQPWQVFELSGYLVQIQEVYSQYGADGVEFFIKYVADAGDGQNPYAQMFRLAKSIWDELDRDFDTATAGAMVVWSILGAYRRDSWNACPSERFVRLREHLRVNGIPDWNGNPMPLFDDWSHALGLSTVGDGLHEATDIFRSRAESLARSRVQLAASVGELNFEHIIGVADGVAAASEHMVDSFLEAPENYVAAHKYLKAVGSLPNPAVRYAIDGAGLHLTRDPGYYKNKGYETWWAIEQGGRQLVVSLLAPFQVSPFHFVDRPHVSALTDLFGLTDFLFAETGRARNDVQIPARVFFREGRIALFDLLP